MKKTISVILAAITLIAALIIPTSAVSVNDSSVFLKQEKNNTCTLASATMMLRRKAILDGNANWSYITETTMRSKGAWPNGLANTVKFNDTARGLSMTTAATTLYSMTNNSNRTNTNTAKVITKLKSLLDEHPEGIVLYVFEYHYNSKGKSVCGWQHAVLLTSYSGSTFYCSDPANSAKSGVINLLDSYLASRANAKTLDDLLKYQVKVWYVKSSANSAVKASAATKTTPTVSVTSAPTSIDEGTSFGLRGTVTSASPITSVKGTITNSAGKVVQSASDKVSSTSVNIRYLNVNNKLYFGKLDAGSYTLCITATDSTGGTATWKSKFTVNADDPIYATVVTKSSPLNLRKSYSTSSKVLASIPKGARVEVLSTAKKNGFYKVKYNGITGYASASYLSID